MTKLRDKCVLITGGVSGIGKLMGRMVLEKGAAKLIIWDINQQQIERTVEEFAPLGKVAGYRVDVSDTDAVEEAYTRVKAEHGAVDVLINNAGIVSGNRTFDKQSRTEIERTMAINALAPMQIARLLLPDMLARNEGHICNIASAAGMLSNPRMSVYAASKWAVIGWSDSVRIELKERKSRVRCTTIAPYYINTGMFDGVSSPILPILKAEPTARKILRAIERNRNFRGIPFGFHFIRLCQAILPTAWFDALFGHLFGIYTAMDHFTGRKQHNQ